MQSTRILRCQPEVVKEARRLRRAGFSYDKISEMLAGKGHLNER